MMKVLTRYIERWACYSFLRKNISDRVFAARRFSARHDAPYAFYFNARLLFAAVSLLFFSLLAASAIELSSIFLDICSPRHDVFTLPLPASRAETARLFDFIYSWCAMMRFPAVDIFDTLAGFSHYNKKQPPHFESPISFYRHFFASKTLISILFAIIASIALFAPRWIFSQTNIVLRLSPASYSKYEAFHWRFLRLLRRVKYFRHLFYYASFFFFRGRISAFWRAYAIFT